MKKSKILLIGISFGLLPLQVSAQLRIGITVGATYNEYSIDYHYMDDWHYMKS